MDPNLVVIRLARTMGYGLFSIKVLILTEAEEALAVASSNFFARSILYFFLPLSGKKKKPLACSDCSFSRSKFMIYVLSKIITTSSIYVTCRGKILRV